MSRRASVFARSNPGKRRVRFPDEVIFEDEIKEQDGIAIMSMLRRASVDVDINRINTAGKNDNTVILFGSSRICPLINERQIQTAVLSMYAHGQIWLLCKACQMSPYGSKFYNSPLNNWKDPMKVENWGMSYSC